MKTCVVKSCPNGRKNNHPNSVHFFKPLELERKKKWEMSLGIELNCNSDVCHLHFKAENMRIYEKIIVDGKLKLIPNRLEKGALPTIEPQFIPLEYAEELKGIKASNKPEAQKSRSILIFKEYILKYSMLPPSWLYVENQNRLEFMRIDPTTKQIKNHLRLNEDLSFTVIFANSKELALTKSIDTYNDMYDYLKSVETWPFCVGTEIGDIKFSETCYGVLVGYDIQQKAFKKYRNNNNNMRCNSCLNLRHHLMNSTCDKITATNNCTKPLNIMQNIKMEIIIPDSQKLEDNTEKELIFTDNFTMGEPPDSLLMEIPNRSLIEEDETEQVTTIKSKQTEYIRPRTRYVNIETTTLSEGERLIEHKLALESIEHMPHVCTDCALGYAEENAYQRHMKLHSEEAGGFECNICHIRLMNVDNLRCHKMLHYRRFLCIVCHTQYRDKQSVSCASRCRKRNGDKPNTTKTIKKTTRQKNKIQKRKQNGNINIKGTSAEKELMIMVVTISEEDRRAEHEQALESQKHMPFVCEHCAIGYTLEDDYQEHMKVHDKMAGEYKCDLCHIRLKSNTSLQIHKMKHYRRFRCTICHSNYKDKLTAVSHIVSQHKAS